MTRSLKIAFAVLAFLGSGILALAGLVRGMGDRNPNLPPMAPLERNAPILLLLGAGAAFALAVALIASAFARRSG